MIAGTSKDGQSCSAHEGTVTNYGSIIRNGRYWLNIPEYRDLPRTGDYLRGNRAIKTKLVLLEKLEENFFKRCILAALAVDGKVVLSGRNLPANKLVQLLQENE